MDPKLLPNLHKYKYSAVDKSLVAQYILQPFWSYLVTLFPITMAPNLITLLGLGCIFINLLTLLLLGPNFEQLPSWAYISFGVGLFVYQSLDAIDGKQARRTGTSSPLGQLFDHGCDALNTTLGGIIAASALNLGSGWLTVFSIFAAGVNFYVTTWEEYYTGTLYLGYFNGPVEGVLILVGVYFWSAVYGASWWSLPVHSSIQNMVDVLFGAVGYSFPNLVWNQVFVGMLTLPLVLTVIASLIHVKQACFRAKRSFNMALLNLTPLVALISISVYILHKHENILTNHLIPFLLSFGIALANMVGRIIVNHVVHEKFPVWNSALIPLVMVAYGRYELVYFLLLFTTFAHTYYCVTTMQQIASYLDINIFTIKKKK